jgi:hypothetical protein
MKARIDTPFESWGGFSSTRADDSMIHGRLQYLPDKGIILELVENPQGATAFTQAQSSVETMYGKLVDGTYVTLIGCFISKASIQIGIGIGSPTTLRINRVIFGGYIDDLDKLQLKKYSMTLSSLSNWTCVMPVKHEIAKDDQKPIGFDVTCRYPDSIDIELAGKDFDVQIAHEMNVQCPTGANPSNPFEVKCEAAISICAHTNLSFEVMHEIAWQCQNLLSLLIGHQLSIRKSALIPMDANSDRDPPLQMVFQQMGKHDHSDVCVPEMLLPYPHVKDNFSEMFDRWFARSKQAELATNIFFGSQGIKSSSVNAKFLMMAQAAESYHRSFGSGLYMDQDIYDKAIAEFQTHLPKEIQNDHRQSLKNRLKYGNEHSLRKRMAELFNRIPTDVQGCIATDVSKFITKVVDTRNYYTHYDLASELNTFGPKDAFVAAERLRILIVANLLSDLGVKDEDLLEVLKRNRDFAHWMSQPLSL